MRRRRPIGPFSNLSSHNYLVNYSKKERTSFVFQSQNVATRTLLVLFSVWILWTCFFCQMNNKHLRSCVLYLRSCVFYWDLESRLIWCYLNYFYFAIQEFKLSTQKVKTVSYWFKLFVRHFYQ